jgi:aryl-alcohol dehydrogenase-like predicted oxidoreductase
VPRAEQFGAVKQLLDEGVIRHAGLSEVSVADIKAASQVFRVATVQNAYNMADRGSDDVIDYCEANGIGFIPYYPLGGGGELARSDFGAHSRAGDAPLAALAKAKGATPGQVALAWLLKRSPVMLPIPGTSKVAHLEENAAAAAITLTDAEFAALDAKRR